jgi:hypothetical protein
MDLARKSLLDSYQLLSVTDQVISLASTLVTSGLVPSKAASDALHIAVASVYKIDYLVTSNFKHIANPFLRDRMQRKIAEIGFEMPVMCSPEELLENDEDD